MTENTNLFNEVGSMNKYIEERDQLFETDGTALVGDLMNFFINKRVVESINHWNESDVSDVLNFKYLTENQEIRLNKGQWELLEVNLNALLKLDGEFMFNQNAALKFIAGVNQNPAEPVQPGFISPKESLEESILAIDSSSDLVYYYRLVLNAINKDAQIPLSEWNGTDGIVFLCERPELEPEIYFETLLIWAMKVNQQGKRNNPLN